jgi:hypothetical protein
VPLIIYGLVGIGFGLATQWLMPPETGRTWLAALVGLDGALAGEYVSANLLNEPAQGTMLFVALLMAFLLLCVYRTGMCRPSRVAVPQD